MNAHILMRLLLLAGTLLFLTSCSISYSVEGSSDSIAGSLDSISASFESFTSISTSSGSEKEEVEAALLRFKEDIKGLTRVSLASRDNHEIFERQITEVAMQYGILDWEYVPATCMAIGNGLREGGVAESDIADVSLLQDSLLMKRYGCILKGYQEV